MSIHTIIHQVNLLACTCSLTLSSLDQYIFYVKRKLNLESNLVTYHQSNYLLHRVYVGTHIKSKHSQKMKTKNVVLSGSTLLFLLNKHTNQIILFSFFLFWLFGFAPPKVQCKTKSFFSKVDDWIQVYSSDG